jgi:hypothetical protein
LCCQKVDCFCWLVEPEKLLLSLTDVMSKQKVLGVVASGIILVGTMLAGLQFVVISLLTPQETNA